MTHARRRLSWLMIVAVMWALWVLPAFALAEPVAPRLRAYIGDPEAGARMVGRPRGLDRRDLTAEGRLRVYVHAARRGADLAGLVKHLRGSGARGIEPCAPLNLVSAELTPAAIERLAAHPDVGAIGLRAWGFTRAGANVTEGDEWLGAAPARQIYGVSGAGVRVGVISDGVQDLALAQDSGDLPQQLFIGNPGGDNEGTAMLEIIHDLAPGAELGFTGAGVDIAGFINAVALLKDTFEADIIVDDIGFLTEPFFEDGPVALAAQQAVEEGVHFFSAAGNESETHYEAVFTPGGAPLPGIDGPLHDFEESLLQTDTLMNLGPYGPGDGPRFVLQWSDPFLAPTSVYRVSLYADDTPSPGLPLWQSDMTADNFSARLGGPPRAGLFVDYINTGTVELELFMAIERLEGDAAAFEIFGLASTHEFSDRQGSIFGHPAAAGVVAVSTANWYNNPGGSVRAFSQVGPAIVYHPEYEERPKPEITATDGVTVSGVGGFEVPFIGTSAAAPHAAAIAALLLEAEPGLTPAQLTDVLQLTARDVMSTGFDVFSGAGIVDALAALQYVRPAAVRSHWVLFD